MFEQKIYLSRILDFHSGNIVSYTIFDRPVLKMVTDMLIPDFETIPDHTNLILHSNQVWQYQRMIIDKGIQQSMSRKGNYVDNSEIENFFELLKSELLYLQKFDSSNHFRAEL